MISPRLYIFRFLHQTTTYLLFLVLSLCCISFVFYIKPQLIYKFSHFLQVVYLSFSTSNHNCYQDLFVCCIVVYLSFSTSNHNSSSTVENNLTLYIFRFLHQTTTSFFPFLASIRCISFVFYIKPQPAFFV